VGARSSKSIYRSIYPFGHGGSSPTRTRGQEAEKIDKRDERQELGLTSSAALALFGAYHVFLWHSRRNTNSVFRLVYPEYDIRTYICKLMYSQNRLRRGHPPGRGRWHAPSSRHRWALLSACGRCSFGGLVVRVCVPVSGVFSLSVCPVCV